MANRPAPALRLDEDSRAALTTWTRSRTLPQRQVLRARIVLRAAEGVANRRIADELQCSIPTVLLWRQRFEEAGVAGLEQDAPGRGRPRVHDEQVIAKIISVTLDRPPKGETHWSSREVAGRVGVSRSTVLRAWEDHRPPAPSHPQLQVQHRPRVGAEGHRRDRALPASAGEGGGAVRR